MEELSPKRKGDISELKVLAKLTEFGVDVYLPYGEDTRADLIIDDSKDLEKIQVKTARSLDEENKSLEFNCCSTRSNFNETKSKDYTGEVDAFIVYWMNNDEYYYVSIEEATETKMTIRRKETKNNQSKRVNFAEDYLLSNRFRP